MKPQAWGAIAGAAGATVAGVAFGVVARKRHQIVAQRRRLAAELSDGPAEPGAVPPGSRPRSPRTTASGCPARRSSPPPAGPRSPWCWCTASRSTAAPGTSSARALAELTDPTVRQVIYDLRSHGRSERAARETCTLDQLGQDLAAVIRALAPDGPLVLVGHSMGGMAIMALAEQDPELFAERVAGVALVATSAGEIGSSGLSGSLLSRRNPLTRSVGLVARLQPTLVEGVRRAAGDVIWAITRSFAYGDDNVEPWLVDLVDTMISANAVDALTDFVDTVGSHDRIAALPALAGCEVLVAAGDADRVIPFAHSERIAAELPHATLLRVPRRRAPAHARAARRRWTPRWPTWCAAARPGRRLPARAAAGMTALAGPPGHRAGAARHRRHRGARRAPGARSRRRRPGRAVRPARARARPRSCAGWPAGLGVAGPVTSPTFVIAREHRPLPGGAGVPLVHVDAYRLGSTGADVAAELDDLDLDTDLDGAVLAVEWGEGVAERLSARHLLVRLDRRPDDVRVATVHRVAPA